MLQKITHDAFKSHGSIRILYPGLAMPGQDSGIGSIGRIDHATVHGRQHIGMHPHVNDEILSYFRTGKVQHIDSEGNKDTVGATRLMLMKAGKRFYHEEYIDGQNEPFEGLQIFIRPGGKDLPPEVIFHDLKEHDSENQWRLLASPASDTAFTFSSQTWLYDVKLTARKTLALPPLAEKGFTALLYVYQGSVKVNDEIALNKMESLVSKNEVISIQADEDAELVLFLTDENAAIFKDGMYSGNVKNI
ncbi:pirin family protein [Chitinophaga filiformis]|uniref:Pirin family protein n=1 Tax=Chitinophaga filiformis TaxID=104663 RepID=A0ABY4HZ13_CHIFI|nr:pirin family protein [Chitinophaga filiformis]UPK68845.1 pirin family protein [Chitinophaga filiformis]